MGSKKTLKNFMKTVFVALACFVSADRSVKGPLARTREARSTGFVRSDLECSAAAYLIYAEENANFPKSFIKGDGRVVGNANCDKVVSDFENDGMTCGCAVGSEYDFENEDVCNYAKTYVSDLKKVNEDAVPLLGYKSFVDIVCGNADIGKINSGEAKCGIRKRVQPEKTETVGKKEKTADAEEDNQEEKETESESGFLANYLSLGLLVFCSILKL